MYVSNIQSFHKQFCRFPIIYFKSMADLVDLMCLKPPSFVNMSSQKKPLSKDTLLSEQKNTNTDSYSTIQNYKIFKFISIDSIWSIIATISFKGKAAVVIFNLTKFSEIFRIQSTFLRNFLAGFFSKTNNSILLQKINPLNGQIQLSIHFLLDNYTLNSFDNIIKKISEIKNLHNRVYQFWKKIIMHSEGNFYDENNILFQKKCLDLNILSSLSKKQKQSDSIYNLKNFIESHQKQSDQIEQIKTCLGFNKQKCQPTIHWDLRKNLQQIKRQKKGVQQGAIKNKTFYSNFECLTLNQKQKYQLLSQIEILKSDDQIQRVQDQIYGKLYLVNDNLRAINLQKTISSLSLLSKSCEYNFLNYYFMLKECNRKFLFKVMLKKSSLKKFLHANSHSISFQSKLNIFLKMFYSIQQIWDKLKCHPSQLNISDISLTKSLYVKIQNIHKWNQINKEQQQVTDYEKYKCKTELMTRLRNIFVQIIYSKQSLFRKNKIIKSFRKITYQKNDSFANQANIEEHRTEAHLYGIKQIINSIDYCFQNYQIKQHEIQQKLKFEKFEQTSQRMSKGNLDLVFGTILRNIELFKTLS